ncbi:hypothetical protein P7D85_06755 [Enterococcus hulanensis]|uniref:Uncharacterized protein n=1 Tax=Enterococcus hulanensis TaxID=2559929 RepID=A0ABU3EX69_9ENTE|nr:hypothetical protein [Enterococcus hulanensis]MDT2599469.1 hypothetical protein [Enterococcus hulanensis]MDT2608876.1 hypothetical protein [Enterococcus hulanensis]MDT2616631.1 hypothetical protein [Enterococcus hulanensis]MDT2627329.1 hypothetical protein [Enterococcus hulanensis]MDT2657195.1 hypothetical protein [Enterococcus hulanensis]
MNEIFVVILLISLGIAAYILGWINCKTRMYSVLREAYDVQEAVEDKLVSRGWLECIQFFIDKLNI